MGDRTRAEARSFRSDPRQFREVRNWLALIAREEGFQEIDTQEISVALSEACANIHRHAYLGKTDGRIDLRVEIESRVMRLSVQDYGVAFDPGSYRPPDLSRPAENGYGIYLMRTLMDHVEHHALPAGTRVVMTKQSRPGTGPEGNERRPDRG